MPRNESSKERSGRGDDSYSHSHSHSRKRRWDDDGEDKRSDRHSKRHRTSSTSDNVTQTTKSSTATATTKTNTQSSKLAALSAMLAQKKALLEKQKQELLSKKKGRTPAPPPSTNNNVPSGARKPVSMFNGPHALRVDEQGREIDAFGKVVMPVITTHSTLLINKKAREKDALTMKKEKLARNPYVDPTLLGGGKNAFGVVGRRKPRSFNWVKPGSMIEKAETLKKEMEEKERISKLREENGADIMELDEVDKLSLVTTTEQQSKRLRKRMLLKMSNVEWWDKPYLLGSTPEEKTYDADGRVPMDLSNIDHWVVHPVPIQPPAEAKDPDTLTLPVTKKEQKRIRKQKRAALRKEEQEKQWLGLKEAPPPRVRIANMPRVYGAEMYMDPTQIEVMVTKAMEERVANHTRRNQERKLTPEQRKEKRARKMKEDTPCKQVAVFKVQLKELSRLNLGKVDLNANQMGLTGCCIVNDQFWLVVVEGGPNAIKKYKKLMMRRIKWQPDEDDDEDMSSSEEEEMAAIREQAKSKPKNRCDLVWSGEVLNASFTSFQVKNLRNETVVRNFLAKLGCEHYWDMAKTFISGVLTVHSVV